MNLFTILRNQKIIELNRNRIIEEQKINDSIRNRRKCSANWTLMEVLQKGKASTKKFYQIFCAFNGECNAQIGKVKWNNVKNERTYS
jgi:hypothetical protein